MATLIDTENPRLGRTLDETAQAFEAALSAEAEEPAATDPKPAPAPPKGDDPKPDAEPDGASQTPGESTEPAAASEAEQERPAGPEGDAGTETDMVSIPRAELEDLKANQLRQADYTQRTQKLAETRKAVEAELQGLREEREQLRQQIQESKKVVGRLVPKSPNWEDLKTKVSAEELVAARAEYDALTKTLSEAEAAEQAVSAKQQKDREHQFRERVQTEFEKLVTMVPEWKDDAKRQAAGKEIGDATMAIYGYTPEELAIMAVDHRNWLVLRDAFRYRKAQQKPVAEIPRKPIKTAPPGSTASERPVDGKNRAMNRLIKSGRVEDAAKVFEDLKSLE